MQKMKLDIQLFASGSFEFDNWSSGTTIRGKIEWSSVPDINNNRSSVTAQIYVRRTSGYTTGRQWNGYVNIGGNNHTFSEIYTGSSTTVRQDWVLVEYFTDTITHNTDGTKSITISGEVYGPSGTGLAGKSSWGSGVAVLDTLHKIPDNITYTITETNPLLTSAGISNDLIVENLSIKQFGISYTLYDNATLQSLGIINRTNTYSSTTTPFSIDFRQNALIKSPNDNTKIPLQAFVKDSMNAQGTTSETLYDYIAYTPISLTETSTTAKRDGQVSGKVNLNINGTYFNGTIGNVSQETYKPVIKYKFWKSEASEPSTYSYTIPSASIIISNGTFSVSDYNIGSTSTSATNYFDPDYSYKVKIQVDDNFSTYYSVEKSIPVGEATWTEYPDHVDFKAITIGGSPIIESGSNSNGSYVKYADGTMICYKGIWITSNITNSWGNMYESSSAVSLGSWPQTFTNTPTMSVVKMAGQGAWLELVENYSTTSCGRTYFVSAVNRSNASLNVHIIGIGKWN